MIEGVFCLFLGCYSERWGWLSRSLWFDYIVNWVTTPNDLDDILDVTLEIHNRSLQVVQEGVRRKEETHKTSRDKSELHRLIQLQTCTVVPALLLL